MCGERGGSAGKAKVVESRVEADAKLQSHKSGSQRSPISQPPRRGLVQILPGHETCSHTRTVQHLRRAQTLFQSIRAGARLNRSSWSFCVSPPPSLPSSSRSAMAPKLVRGRPARLSATCSPTCALSRTPMKSRLSTCGLRVVK